MYYYSILNCTLELFYGACSRRNTPHIKHSGVGDGPVLQDATQKRKTWTGSLRYRTTSSTKTVNTPSVRHVEHNARMNKTDEEKIHESMAAAGKIDSEGRDVREEVTSEKNVKKEEKCVDKKEVKDVIKKEDKGVFKQEENVQRTESRRSTVSDTESEV